MKIQKDKLSLMGKNINERLQTISCFSKCVIHNYHFIRKFRKLRTVYLIFNLDKCLILSKHDQFNN